MNLKRQIIRRLGHVLPAALGVSLAKRTRHLRYLAQPGTDFVFNRYLGGLSVWVDTTYPIELEMLTGQYDRETTDLIQKLFQPDWTGIDVGANVGAVTLVMAAAARNGRVIAIEPGPFLCQRLRKNLALNPTVCGAVQVLEVGVSDKEGRLFWNEDQNNRGNAGLLAREGHSVSVTTLDQVVKDQQLSRLDFIKIDVEGMEYEVIKGGASCISSLRPILYYETLEPFRKARGFDLYSQIYDLLSPMGYQHFALGPGGKPQPVTGLKTLQSSNVLAVPAERVSALRSISS